MFRLCLKPLIINIIAPDLGTNLGYFTSSIPLFPKMIMPNWHET